MVQASFLHIWSVILSMVIYMKQPNENHRLGIEAYFHSPSVQPIMLAAEEIEIINKFLERLYADLGNIIWIKFAFTTALNAYWKTKNATREDAKQHEEVIGPQIHRVIVARQFSRATTDVIKNYIMENTIDTVPYWNDYPDQYPPPGIENMNEPFRRFFLLLKDLVQEMDKRDNPTQSASFLASLIAAVALTYPISYLAADPYFQKYLKNEGINEPLDDDYTFYLCRDMDYTVHSLKNF
jgi:hypothetical protein